MLFKYGISSTRIERHWGSKKKSYHSHSKMKYKSQFDLVLEKFSIRMLMGTMINSVLVEDQCQEIPWWVS